LDLGQEELVVLSLSTRYPLPSLKIALVFRIEQAKQSQWMKKAFLGSKTEPSKSIITCLQDIYVASGKIHITTLYSLSISMDLDPMDLVVGNSGIKII
jgi:hypothetical protein